MDNLIWTRINRYFSLQEKWGEPQKISGMLLMILYDLRFYSGWPIIIHCGTQGEHCKKSYHYKGLAVDFHFKTPNGSVTYHNQVKYLLEYLEDMQLADFVGLGSYPHWNSPGFHLDVRGHKARWKRNKKGEYVEWDG